MLYEVITMTRRTPSSCRVLIASGVLSLIGSETATRPVPLPFTVTNITVEPSRRSSSARDTRRNNFV